MAFYFISAFAYSEDVAPNVDQTALAKTAILAKLKDPESAQFSKMRLSNDGQYVCGFVNAKNSYGGYAGAKEFVVSLSNGTFADIGKELLPDDVRPREFNKEISNKCNLSIAEQDENINRIKILSSQIKKTIQGYASKPDDVKFSEIYAPFRSGNTICGRITDYAYKDAGFFNKRNLTNNAKFSASLWDGKLYLKIEGLTQAGIFTDRYNESAYNDMFECTGHFYSEK